MKITGSEIKIYTDRRTTTLSRKTAHTLLTKHDRRTDETELKTDKPTYLNHTSFSSYKNPVYKNVKLKKITLETHPEQKNQPNS